MTHLPFINQSCGDVLSETAHLSTEEFGAYQLLAFAFWQHGALPEDDERLARIVRATPERWAEMKPGLQELFGIDWCPEALADRRDKIETAHLKKVAAGKATARKRWGDDSSPSSSANSIATSSANSSPSSNYNHNHNTPRHEDKALPYTRARARTDKNEPSDKWVAPTMGPPTTYGSKKAEARGDNEKVDKFFLEKKDAGAWLAAIGAFPGDAAFDRCVDKLVAGTATWGDVHVASS